MFARPEGVGGVELYFLTFLNWDLEVGELSGSRPGSSTLKEKVPSSH